MYSLTNIAAVAEILGAIIVVGGIGFAVLQIRQFRQQRRELAAIEMFRFFGNPQFARAYRTVLHLPDDMSADDIKSGANGLEDQAMLIATTMENIGVMTYQQIVPFKVVRNLIGNSTILLWRKLENWTDSIRDEVQMPHAFEWFQWLAERLQEHQQEDWIPAYRRETRWKPKNVQKQL